MAKTSKFFIFIIAFMILMYTVHAAAFDINVTAVKDRIVVDEIAEFNLTIQNNLEIDEQLIIKPKKSKHRSKTHKSKKR